MSGWIGVDLDGTLARYGGFISLRGEIYIGEPVPAMLERVKRWLDDGIEVKIFTARVSVPSAATDEEYAVAAADARAMRTAIEQWCLKHVGRILPVTCIKDYGMIELWDDRAVRVPTNAGEPCCNHIFLANK